jgi:hypothetical protein
MATTSGKRCPYCGQEISVFAKKCGRCGKYLDDPLKTENPPDSVERMLLPEGRPLSAIASGYLGLISFFPLLGILFGLLAVLFGSMALKAIKKDPTLSGKGRAWFGIVVGGLMLVVQCVVLLIVVISSGRR